VRRRALGSQRGSDGVVGAGDDFDAELDERDRSAVSLLALPPRRGGSSVPVLSSSSPRTPRTPRRDVLHTLRSIELI
jgi:hypothetical protein